MSKKCSITFYIAGSKLLNLLFITFILYSENQGALYNNLTKENCCISLCEFPTCVWIYEACWRWDQAILWWRKDVHPQLKMMCFHCNSRWNTYFKAQYKILNLATNLTAEVRINKKCDLQNYALPISMVVVILGQQCGSRDACAT
jgi:hypothetical protein